MGYQKSEKKEGKKGEERNLGPLYFIFKSVSDSDMEEGFGLCIDYVQMDDVLYRTMLLNLANYECEGE